MKPPSQPPRLLLFSVVRKFSHSFGLESTLILPTAHVRHHHLLKFSLFHFFFSSPLFQRSSPLHIYTHFVVFADAAENFQEWYYFKGKMPSSSSLSTILSLFHTFYFQGDRYKDKFKRFITSILYIVKKLPFISAEESAVGMKIKQSENDINDERRCCAFVLIELCVHT